MDKASLQDHFLKLENQLLHQDFSDQPEALAALLSEDFREVNPDGENISRQSVFNWLLHKDQAKQWELSDFKAQLLAPGLAQTIYHAKQIAPGDSQSKGSIHCSLWKECSASKTWQLIFHQSTRVS